MFSTNSPKQRKPANRHIPEAGSSKRRSMNDQNRYLLIFWSADWLIDFSTNLCTDSSLCGSCGFIVHVKQKNSFCVAEGPHSAALTHLKSLWSHRCVTVHPSPSGPTETELQHWMTKSPFRSEVSVLWWYFLCIFVALNLWTLRAHDWIKDVTTWKTQKTGVRKHSLTGNDWFWFYLRSLWWGFTHLSPTTYKHTHTHVQPGSPPDHITPAVLVHSEACSESERWIQNMQTSEWALTVLF